MISIDLSNKNNPVGVEYFRYSLVILFMWDVHQPNRKSKCRKQTLDLSISYNKNKSSVHSGP